MDTDLNIREICKALQISQRDLSRKLGVNIATVNRWATRGIPKGGTAKVALAALAAEAREQKHEAAE